MTLSLVVRQKQLALTIRRLQKWQQKLPRTSDPDLDLDAQLEKAIQALVVLHLAVQYKHRQMRKAQSLHAS